MFEYDDEGVGAIPAIPGTVCLRPHRLGVRCIEIEEQVIRLLY
jgi:hypothetical protein